MWGTPIDKAAIDAGLIDSALPNPIAAQPPSTSTAPQNFLSRRSSLLFSRKSERSNIEDTNPNSTSSSVTSARGISPSFFKASRRPTTSPSDQRSSGSSGSSPPIRTFTSSTHQDQLGQAPEFSKRRALRSSQSYSTLVLQKRNQMISSNEWGRKTFTSSELENLLDKPRMVGHASPASTSHSPPSTLPPTPPTSMPSSPSDLKRATAFRSRSPSVPKTSSRIQWLQDSRSHPPPLPTPPTPISSSLEKTNSYFPLGEWSEVNKALNNSKTESSSMTRTMSKDSIGSSSGSNLSYDSPFSGSLQGRGGALRIKWEKGYEKPTLAVEGRSSTEEEEKELLEDSSSSSVYSQDESFRYSGRLSSKFPVPPPRSASLDSNNSATWPDSPLSRSHSPTSTQNVNSNSSNSQPPFDLVASESRSRSGSGETTWSDETEGIVKAFLLNSSRSRSSQK